MALEQGGRVVLKIYSKTGVLLVARPCPNEEFARKWYDESRIKEDGESYELIAMVPRI